MLHIRNICTCESFICGVECAGYVTVVFESSWNRPTQAVTSGFNVTYYIMLPNATNNTSVSDANGGATDEGHCPNNCTSIDHGNCVNVSIGAACLRERRYLHPHPL